MHRILFLWLFSALAVVLSGSLAGQTAPTLDPKFQPQLLTTGNVEVVLAQPDGKLLAAGNFTLVGSTPALGICRFNPDGTLDSGFLPNYATEGHPAGYNVTAAALQADGKIVVAGSFPASYYDSYTRVYRLNPDGSQDASFRSEAVFTSRYIGVNIYALATLPDGKVVVGGFFDSYGGAACNGLVCLNADGSLNPVFQPVIDGNEGQSRVYALVSQPDGKLLVGGFFGSFAATPRHGLARLNPDGSLDPAFDPGALLNGNVTALALQADGRVLVGGTYRTADTPYGNGVFRLGADGAFDAGFGIVNFAANIQTLRLAAQGNGGVIVEGDFNAIGGTSRRHVARLTADGAVDPDFQPHLEGTTRALVALADNTVVAGGSFHLGDSEKRTGLVRLRSDGVVERVRQAIPYNSGNIINLAVQDDGKVLVNGSLTRVNGVARPLLARLHSDGSTDLAFEPGLAPRERVEGMTLQPDGKVLLDGSFDFVDGQSTASLARLNADGTRDIDFYAPTELGGDVRRLLPQEDGTFYAVGSFFKSNGKSKPGGVYRFNADGSHDHTFLPAQLLTKVDDAALQRDGRLVVAVTVQSGTTTQAVIARSNVDGTLDASFTTAVLGTEDYVEHIAVQSDDKVVVAGTIHTVNGVTRHGLFRLNTDGTLDEDYHPGDNPGDDLDETAYRLQALPDDRMFVEGLFRQSTLR